VCWKVVDVVGKTRKYQRPAVTLCDIPRSTKPYEGALDVAQERPPEATMPNGSFALLERYARSPERLVNSATLLPE